MRADETTRSRNGSDGAKPKRRRGTGDAALGIIVAVLAAGLIWLAIVALIARFR